MSTTLHSDARLVGKTASKRRKSSVNRLALVLDPHLLDVVQVPSVRKAGQAAGGAEHRQLAPATEQRREGKRIPATQSGVAAMVAN